MTFTSYINQSFPLPLNGNVTPVVDFYRVTSAGANTQVALSTAYTLFEVTNTTQWNAAPATPVAKYSEWCVYDNQGTARSTTNIASTTSDQKTTYTTNGIYQYNSGYQFLGTPTTGTAITNANPAVCTSANSLVNGNTVLITSATGMQQIVGMTFTVSNVSPTAFTLAYLNASAFASPATAFTWIQVSSPVNSWLPAASFITAITSSGNNTIVTLSTTTNLVANKTVQLFISPAFGMQGLTVGYQIFTVTAVNTATNQITIPVNSTTYGTFAFPSNAQQIASPSQLPQMVPVGVYPNVYSPGEYVNNQWYVILGSNVCGSPGDILDIKAILAGASSSN